MRVIFVPVADRPECIKALRTAFDLAQQFNANICGCHIRPHEYSDVAFSRARGALADSEAAWEKVCAINGEADSPVAARCLFEKIAGHLDFRMIKKPGSERGAYWVEKVGSPNRVLANMGPVSDLLIVSRPRKRGGKLAHLFMIAAVLNSSRPVLVLPQSGKPPQFKRISIAWNQSPEAAHAVAASLPLLQLADQVHIVSNGPETGLGPKSTQLATYLGFWGIKAKRVGKRLADDAGAITEAFRETGSDLLVMGGYSRSRLREHVFGGVTEYMLHEANFPVLILHN